MPRIYYNRNTPDWLLLLLGLQEFADGWKIVVNGIVPIPIFPAGGSGGKLASSFTGTGLRA